MSSASVPIKKYLLYFTAAYVPLLALKAIILSLANKDSSSIGIAFFLAATALPAHKFVRDTNRVPNREERLKFAFGGILIAMIIDAIILGTVYLSGAEEAAAIGAVFGSSITIFFILFIALIEFAAAFFAFDWFAGMTMKSIERKKSAASSD